MGGLNGIFGINTNQQMYGAGQVNKGFNFGGTQVDGGSQQNGGNKDLQARLGAINGELTYKGDPAGTRTLGFA